MHDAVTHQHGPDTHSRAPGHQHGPDTNSQAPGHQHGHAAGHVRERPPENTDNLILDIGAGTGALVVHAAADRDQAEVEISPAGTGQARTHNVVRLRNAPGRSVYAAVFPALPAGRYDVWRDQAAKAGTVLVHGGEVASFRLD